MVESIVAPNLALEIVAELATAAAKGPDVEQLLQRAVELAIEIVPGCEDAGVSVMTDGRIDTPVSVGELARRCDQLQEKLGNGPCISALLESDTFVVDDLNDEARWPQFTDLAHDAGLGSMLACRLASTRYRLAALNLYSTQRSAFDEVSESFAVAYAAHVGLALGAVERERNLRAALESRELIGQAMGILMERHRIAATQAFDFLVEASQRTHLKLRVIAEDLVRTGGATDAAAAVMMLVRRVARPMLASIFVLGGLDAFRNPAPKAPAAEGLLGEHLDDLPVVQTSSQLVRADGALKVVGGLALALNRAPRLAAAGLAMSLVPTTLAGHRFWEETDPAQRAAQRIHFAKNAAILGGLLLAIVDSPGGRSPT